MMINKIKSIVVFNLVLLIIFSSCKSQEKNDNFIIFSCQNKSVGKGHIQGLFGIKPKDSIPTHFFLECYDNKESYEIIWSPKMDLKEWNNKQELISTSDLYTDNKLNNLGIFNIYKLVHPIKDPISLDDYHDINIFFPLISTIFKEEKGRWKKIKILEIKNFEEYSLLRYKLFYNMAI